MKKTALATGFVIIAIAISACIGGTTGSGDAGTPSSGTPSAHESSAAPSTGGPTATPSPTGKSEAEKKADAQKWADAAYDSWFTGMQYTYIEDPNAGMFCDEFDDVAGYRDCVPNDPHAYIESFTATEPGHLVVTVSPDSRWQDGTYDKPSLTGLSFVSGNVGARLEEDDFPVEEVTAKLKGTDESETYREDTMGKFGSGKSQG